MKDSDEFYFRVASADSSLEKSESASESSESDDEGTEDSKTMARGDLGMYELLGVLGEVFFLSFFSFFHFSFFRGSLVRSDLRNTSFLEWKLQSRSFVAVCLKRC
jgi:hypothetical protein